MLVHYITKQDKDGLYIVCLSWGGCDPMKTKDPDILNADFDDLLDTVYCTKNHSKVTCHECLKHRRKKNEERQIK